MAAKCQKKSLFTFFFKTLWSPHVVQLSVNFWYLGLLVLGANLVLGSMLVGNHWSKAAPKLENSLLIFFSLALASQPFKCLDLFDSLFNVGFSRTWFSGPFAMDFNGDQARQTFKAQMSK